MTDPLRKRLRPLYATQEMAPERIIVSCQFFLRGTPLTWYPIEFDQVDTFFGLIGKAGSTAEWDYFTLDDLLLRKGPLGFRVERYKYFGKCTVQDILSQYGLAKVTRPFE